MKKNENTNPEPVWNLQELLARVDNDLELVRDLLAIFHEDSPEHISSLGRAVAAGDLSSVAAVAHSLKGMLSNLSALRASAAVARLERMARNGEKEGLTEAFKAFQREMNSLTQELASYSAEVRT